MGDIPDLNLERQPGEARRTTWRPVFRPRCGGTILRRRQAPGSFNAVLAATPIAIARAASSSEAAPDMPRAIDIVSASTSVSPSTAAVVRIPDVAPHPIGQMHRHQDDLKQRSHAKRVEQLEWIVPRVSVGFDADMPSGAECGDASCDDRRTDEVRHEQRYERCVQHRRGEEDARKQHRVGGDRAERQLAIDRRDARGSRART